MLVTLFLKIEGDAPAYEKYKDEEFACLPPRDSLYITEDGSRAFKMAEFRFKAGHIGIILEEIKQENIEQELLGL